ncbi:MAG: hypothetical protein AB7V42_05390 [Thermoleophilia bacterium]
MSDYLDLDSLWRVAVLSLCFGAGVVGLYAVAIAGLAGDAEGRRGRGARAVAALCLAGCAAAVVTGIWVMLSK